MEELTFRGFCRRASVNLRTQETTLMSIKEWLVQHKLLVGVVFVALLFPITYLLGSRSESFRFVETVIRNSQKLQSRIGRIEDLRLARTGEFREYMRGSDKWANLSVVVTGKTETVTIDVDARKIDGVWNIEHASIDGKPVSLK